MATMVANYTRKTHQTLRKLRQVRTEMCLPYGGLPHPRSPLHPLLQQDAPLAKAAPM